MRVSADKLVKNAGVRTGATVLDVATGTGWVATGLSKVVGPTGHIVGVDISDDMLEKARRKVQALDITNIKLKLGDGARPEFEDGSFDNVVCSSGLFWIPEMLTALKEWKRVVKPGGQIAFTSFGLSFRQPLEDLFFARLQQYGIAPFQPASRRLDHPDTCARLMADAGLTSINVSVEPGGYNWETPEQYWEFEVLGSVFARGVAQIPLPAQAQFKSEHLEEVSRLATSDGIWIDVPVIVTTGWKS